MQVGGGEASGEPKKAREAPGQATPSFEKKKSQTQVDAFYFPTGLHFTTSIETAFCCNNLGTIWIARFAGSFFFRAAEGLFPSRMVRATPFIHRAVLVFLFFFFFF